MTKIDELNARIAQLEAELAAPIMTAVSRLVDALADARMEREKLAEALGRIWDNGSEKLTAGELRQIAYWALHDAGKRTKATETPKDSRPTLAIAGEHVE